MDRGQFTHAHISQTAGFPAAAQVEPDRVSLISPPLWAINAFLVSRMLILLSGWGAVSRRGEFGRG